MAAYDQGTDTPAGDNVPIYSVGELSNALKRAVEEGFGWVRVRGEISGFRRAASGHLYFSMKDEDAVLDAVCWRGTAGRLHVAPEDGVEVIASGKLTTYPARSRYQIVIQSLELAGEGALLKLLEDRKKRLTEEGLFEEARKRPLPYLPETIGVVTSPTGAVIRDILHRIADRFPRHVLVWPVLVQGEGAAAQIAAAIEGFNVLAAGGAVPRPDVLIVARGGGSLEDLWAFNEEVVVRAAAASEIPLISAVGHETDTTLIDFASDRRAPTPTAAAELAVPVRAELLESVLSYEGRLLRAVRRALEERRARIEGLARGLPDASSLLGTAMQRLDDWSERLTNAMSAQLRERDQQLAKLRPPHPRQIFRLKSTQLDALSGRLQNAHPAREIVRAAERLEQTGAELGKVWKAFVNERDNRLATATRLLESYSYKGVLKRGYAVVRDEKEQALTSAKSISAGKALTLEFDDGRAPAVGVDGPGRPKKRVRKSGPDDPGKQGSLL